MMVNAPGLGWVATIGLGHGSVVRQRANAEGDQAEIGAEGAAAGR